MTNGTRTAHNPEVVARREQTRSDTNREMSIHARRILSDLLKRVTERADWFGKVHLSITIERGEIKVVSEVTDRAYRIADL